MSVFDFLIQGGPAFMFSILALLILVIVLIVKGIKEKGANPKTLKLILAIGLFTFVLGILGQSIGIVMALGVIQEAADISPQLIYGGLRVSAFAPLFGLFTLLVSLVGRIILIWIKKD